MKAIDAQNKAVAAAAAEQRKLDRSSAANMSTSLAPAKKQWMLSKACIVQGSSEQTWLSAPRS